MTSDDQVLMVGLAVTMLPMLAIAVSMAREEWIPAPWNSAAKRRRNWRIFWLITAAIFAVVEALTFFGLGWIPVTAFLIVIGVVVIGGFIGMLTLPRY